MPSQVKVKKRRSELERLCLPSSSSSEESYMHSSSVSLSSRLTRTGSSLEEVGEVTLRPPAPNCFFLVASSQRSVSRPNNRICRGKTHRVAHTQLTISDSHTRRDFLSSLLMERYPETGSVFVSCVNQVWHGQQKHQRTRYHTSSGCTSV